MSGLQTLDAQRVDIDARRVQKPPRERIENRDSVLPRNFHWFQFANHVTKQYHGVSATWFVVRRLRTERHPPRLFSILSNYFKRESSNFATVVQTLVRLRDVDDDFVMASCKFIRLLTILGRPFVSFLRTISIHDAVYKRNVLTAKRFGGSSHRVDGCAVVSGLSV